MSRHSSPHRLSMEGILGYNKARPRFPGSSSFSLDIFFFFLLLFSCNFSTAIYVSLVFFAQPIAFMPLNIVIFLELPMGIWEFQFEPKHESVR